MGEPTTPKTPSSETPPGKRNGSFARAWRLVRGEHQGPVSRFMARKVDIRVGSRRRQASIGALTALGTVVVLILASVLVFATPLFGARSIDVTGVKQLSVQRVKDAAAVDSGTPLARLNTQDVARRVLSIPQVQKAQVTRSWPGTVRIKVKERRPAGVAQQGNQFVIIDAVGVPYLVSKTRPADLPLIAVADPARVAIPDFSATPQPKKDKTLVAMARTARALTPELREQLVKITATDQRRVVLELRGGRTFVWGAADDPTDNIRKATVATVLLGKPGKQVDVSTPGVVSVR